jgi:flavin-dependent dehydrogenase
VAGAAFCGCRTVLLPVREKLNTIAIIGGGPAGATAAERLARGRKQPDNAVECCDCARKGVGQLADHVGSHTPPPRGTLRHGPTLKQTGESLRRSFHSGIDLNTRILLFEEKLGWEKPCGGGLPFRALRRYPFLLDAAGPHNCIRDVEMVADGGESVCLRSREPLAVYSRAELNRMLLDRAGQAGAEVIVDRILDFRPSTAGWRIQGRRAGYRSDYLILAGGARTRLRGLVAPHFHARDFMLTFGYYIPGSDRLLRVQFFDDFEGYCWSFPRTDHLSLGICGKATENRMPDLRERLHAFIRRFAYPMVRRGRPEIFSHLLPALSAESWHSLELVGPGWALAGDCAGLVDSLTGEGIYFAMRSGELLAESLLEGAPECYPPRVWQDFGRKLALGSRLAHLFYHGDFLGGPSTTRLVQFAAHSPAFTNLLENLIAGEQSYSGLALELYKTFGRAALDLARGRLSQLSLH